MYVPSTFNKVHDPLPQSQPNEEEEEKSTQVAKGALSSQFGKRKRVSVPPHRIVSATTKKARTFPISGERREAIYTFYGLHAESTELQQQVMAIEDYFAHHLADRPLDDLRDKIKEICQRNALHSEKMAQLGILLYLIETGNKIDIDNSSFVEMYGDALLRELSLIKGEYKTGLRESICALPSGTMQSLLSSLARLVITSEQKVNRGALYAILELIEGSELARYFQPEHHDHLLFLFRTMISNSDWIPLLEQRIDVHPTMAPFICLDLKCPFEGTVSSLQASRACLLFLLWDLRQNHNESNCYALASVILMSEQTIDKVLARLIDHLTKGRLELAWGRFLPFAPLLGRYLTNETDFNVCVTASEFASLRIFRELCPLLGLKDYENPSYEDDDVFLDRLKEFLEDHDKRDSLPYALSFLNSYKLNVLGRLILLGIELEYTNGVNPDKEESCLSYDKENFIETLLHGLAIPSHGSLYSERLKWKMEGAFWFDSHAERDVREGDEEGTLLVGLEDNALTIQVDVEQEESLKKALLNSRKLCFFWNQRLTLVETLSSLQKYVEQLASETATEMGLSVEEYAPIRESILSPKYLMRIAYYCAVCIKEDKIEVEAETLHKSDVLVFNQSGGRAEVILNRFFQLKTETLNVKAPSAESFLYELQKACSTFEPETLDNKRLLIAQSNQHDFLFDLQRTKGVLESPDLPGFVKESVLERAEARLQQMIPQKTQRVILRKTTRIEKRLEELKPLFLETPLTYREFRDRIISSTLLNPEEMDRFLRAVLDEYSKVTLPTDSLIPLLEELGLEPEVEEVEALSNALQRKFGKKLQKPFVFARFLSKLLVKQKLPYFDPYEIESALCQLTQMPLTFDIADLNWLDALRETPAHRRLVIGYNFVSEQLDFFIRVSIKEALESAESYSDFTLFFIK